MASPLLGAYQDPALVPWRYFPTQANKTFPGRHIEAATWNQPGKQHNQKHYVRALRSYVKGRNEDLAKFQKLAVQGSHTCSGAYSQLRQHNREQCSLSRANLIYPSRGDREALFKDQD